MPVNKKLSGLSRRDFLKLMGAAGTSMAFAPFVPFGNFMPNPADANLSRQKAEYLVENLDGSKDWVHANVNRFPTNHYELVTYPKTESETLNGEPFRQWNLVRLPEEMGGGANDTSAFRAFSAICLHLWCFWEYKDNLKEGYCPCHGSEYDARTGRATMGPASVQSAPSNVLPKLDLDMDKDGYLWIKEPKMRVDENGIVGYGRFPK